MTLNSVRPNRTLVLTVKTVDAEQPYPPHHARSADHKIIASICVAVDNGTQTTGYSLCHVPEGELLRGFWQLVRPNDVFVGLGIVIS
jgi:hypothetical protein